MKINNQIVKVNMEVPGYKCKCNDACAKKMKDEKSIKQLAYGNDEPRTIFVPIAFLTNF